MSVLINIMKCDYFLLTKRLFPHIPVTVIVFGPHEGLPLLFGEDHFQVISDAKLALVIAKLK